MSARTDTTGAAPGGFEDHPALNPWRRFALDNRAALGSLGVFVGMMLLFFFYSVYAGSPGTFLDWGLYRSVLTILPVALFLVVPLVFIVASGEIDLSFPAVMGLSGWVFAISIQAGFDPFIALILAVLAGALLGFLVGSIVVYLNLSSLVATLGMNFMLRGIIQIINQGKNKSFPELKDSYTFQFLTGEVSVFGYGVPVQIFWGLAFVAFAAYLFNRHRFGAQVKIVGDNPESARQMAIDVDRVRVKTFVFMGIGAALAACFSSMINFTWFTTSGEGYLLTALAAVFVGGTPTWGGVGTVVGGAIGALTVSFIETGIVATGFTGFYIKFFNGLIIILSLIGHRWNQARYR